jgi:hypothetical protein
MPETPAWRREMIEFRGLSKPILASLMALIFPRIFERGRTLMTSVNPAPVCKMQYVHRRRRCAFGQLRLATRLGFRYG